MPGMFRRICCLSLFPLLLSGQNFSETWSIAESAFAEGQYNTALGAYQRINFFAGNESVPALYQRLAECYRQVGRYDLAELYYDRAYFTAVAPGEERAALLGKVRSLVAQGAYPAAIAEIYSLDSLSKLAHFYLGLCHFHREDYGQAELSFMAAANTDFQARRIALAFADADRLHEPIPRKATNLSYVFPGLGQFYAGDVKNGLNSMGLAAGLVALGIQVGLRYTFVDALLLVVPWFQRYYLGGAERAGLLAEGARYDSRREVLWEVMEAFAPAAESGAGHAY
jgi:hypothetical protein